MTAPEAASNATKSSATPRASWREGWAVYLQRRVLIVLLLGFSSGLPLALSGSTLLVWMRVAPHPVSDHSVWGLSAAPSGWSRVISGVRSRANVCKVYLSILTFTL